MKLLEFVKEYVEEGGGVKLFPWQEKLLKELENNKFNNRTIIMTTPTMRTCAFYELHKKLLEG